ncbi:M3 family oligoendopeptidase [Acutalibacter sp. 1XD8-33]|uniref:M3 family oligoendopeptidase n=1 Tax=Acutalibacter sp. 1XD8-33 TaxID=2320081 RepID=UPI000EA1E019|nr:M3 family oligoendopeptidase [Acutalibacter sp. 1XD8-33]RKJ38662.1 M3 family oligoendopeptidase [Acutalibacter sp. 1XD8-33]
MKFSQMPYSRPDMPAMFAQLDGLTARLKEAGSAGEQLALYKEKDALMSRFNTLSAICSIRNTVDTRDKFYEDEQAYLDEQYPLISEKLQAFNRALAESPFRPELEEELGALVFTNIEIELRSFSPEIVPLMQEENRLCTEYQKLYASARIEFMGKTVTIAQLGPYKQDPDRAVRKAAVEAEGTFFDQHQAQFDELYDKLVKNRTEQAKKLGFENYLPLGFLRMGRNCYTPEDLDGFRRQVVRDLVPLAVKVKERQQKRLGLDSFKFYDDPLKFRDGSAKPQGTPEEIMAAGKRMYHELSAETGEFIDLMMENELFDVLAKEGKAPGGYCTNLPDYKYPFIFSNFNGTSGDVDVLTHEAGHAFADYIAARTIDIAANRWPTMEGCETHSMSMEFLTAPWHHLFFGPMTDKYELSHGEDALTFIPYGCLVDHFQQEVYSHPEMTPEERNQTWALLEKVYRPYLDMEGIPFYGRGAGWQRQTHIYQSPFYYIDYCLAQVMSLQFFALSLEDRQKAWEKYMAFVRLGGTRTFVDLAHGVDMRSPLDEGCVKDVCAKTYQWTQAHLVE